LSPIRRLSIDPGSVTRSYAFLMASLMFGLPLGLSYYLVQEDPTTSMAYLIGYIAASVVIGLGLLLRFGRRSRPTPVVSPTPAEAQAGGLAAFGSRTAIAMTLATIAVIAYAVMRYFVSVVYPLPSSQASLAGAIYLLTVGGASVVGFPTLVSGGFRVVREALAVKRYRRLAVLTGLAYFLTYEILVNEILITGYNTGPGNVVASPQGSYPWAYVFTSGPAPSNPLEIAIYVPYVLIQLNSVFNFVIQPFEMVLALLISTLVAANAVSTFYSIRRSSSIGGACSTGATLSGIGAFIGYTATCPSCLAPTLVSVFFGGVAAIQTSFSSLTGAVVPPLVSVVALTLSLEVLNRGVSKTAAGPDASSEG
jgi:hypothetical protein